MSNYDKIVKGACKPKNQPPKAKYVDQLVSATFSSDGSLNDITRSLSLRLREPNAVVVFKALLTLHQMIRQGSTEALLEHLAGGDSLRLRNVGSGNWEGYTPPSSMSNYAQYLDSRIRAWRELKHDLVKVQADSNRRSDGLGAASKARRLRHLPVEKGLLREVQQVQKVLDALLQCKFYDDDLKDENTVLAFRMLVKDVLVLFQAGNEGVCNILEHYFEMSKPDAQSSFDIYKSFIKQTDRVVDYLGVARKLQNVVNVPVPNLKHAPTSLVRALEEYLNDPNFEQNRLEYKKSLGIVEGRSGGGGRTPSPNPTAKKEDQKPKVDTSNTNGSASTSAPASATSPISAVASAPPGASRKIQDFFDSIQSDQQPTMFGGPAQQLNYGSMNTAFNPFRASMMPQQTGMMGFGMVQPQMTGFGPGPGPMGQVNQFGQPQPQQQQQSFMQPQQSGLPGQQTSFHQPQPQTFQQPGFMGQSQSQPQPSQLQQQPTGFIQPQATGSNPFRQSTMFGPGINTRFGAASGAAAGSGGNAFSSQPSSPFHNNPHGLARSGSVPIGGTPGQGQAQLQPQATGAKNPFAPAGGAQAAKSSSTGAGAGGMSMNDLAWTRQFGQSGPAGGQAGGQGQGQQTGAWGTGAGGTGFGFTSSPSSASAGTSSPFPGMGAATQGSGMSDIASAFASSSSASNGGANGAGDDFLAQFGSLSTSTSSPAPGSSAFSAQGTGSSSPVTTHSSATNDLLNAFGSPSSSSAQIGGGGGFIQPQPTGFGGSTVKRFQPTSSFGRQAVESLAPISESPGLSGPGQQAGPGGQAGQGGYPFGHGSGNGTTSPPPGGQAQSTGPFGFASPQPASNQPFGSPGAGMAAGGIGAQMTGQNPFRQTSSPLSFGQTGPGAAAFASGAGQPFGAGMGAFGQPQGQGQQQHPQQQQQQGAGAGGLAGAFGFPQQNGGGSLI